MKRLLDYGEEQGVDRCRAVALWKLKTTENVLLSLLKNGLDKIAW